MFIISTVNIFVQRNMQVTVITAKYIYQNDTFDPGDLFNLFYK